MSSIELSPAIPGPELSQVMLHGLELVTASRMFPHQSITAEAGAFTMRTDSLRLPLQLFEEGTAIGFETGAEEGVQVHRATFPTKTGEQAIIYGFDLDSQREISPIQHENAYALAKHIGSIAVPMHSARISFPELGPPALLIDTPYPQSRVARKLLVDSLYATSFPRRGEDRRHYTNHRVLPVRQGGGDLDIAVRDPQQPTALVKVPARGYTQRTLETDF